jgi:hypothetical protein
MSGITVSDAFISQVSALPEPTPLLDSQGHMIGTFVPVITPRYSPNGVCNSPISDEELERNRQETGGMTLAEFWKKMGRT